MASEDLALYEQIVESTSEGVWVIDAQSVTRFVNQAMATMLGYTRAELVGKSMFDLMDDEGRRIAASNVERRKHGISEAHEFVFRRKDGSALWTRLTTNPLNAPDGAYRGAFALVTDLTLERRALAERDRLWRILDESLNEIYIFGRDDLRFVYANRGALKNLGYTLEQMREMTPLDVKPQQTSESFAALVEPLVRGTRPKIVFQTVHRRSDGSEYRVEAHLQLAPGDTPVFVAIINDISERVTAEERLQQAQRLGSIGRLAGGIAHDFNNLLTAIVGSASFLKDEPSLSEAAREDVGDILRAGARAGDLTNQLLAFASRRVVQPRNVDLGALIRGQERLLARLIGEQVELRTTLAITLWAVHADPSQLEQMVLNLVVNARDAMPNGGKISVEASNVMLDEAFAAALGLAAGPTVVLTVSDTGEGIAADVLPHIFEPFFTTKAVGAGTGLGLATVWGIVRQCNGHIAVSSEVGLGTTFKVYLPRAPNEELAIDSAPAAAPSQGHERVLVVEDEESVRRMVVRALEAGGYVVHAEASPHAALAAAERERYDLVVTDVVMPGMNGRELAAELKRRWPALRVLFVSGYAEDTIVHRGVLAPSVDFLSKPFAPADLRRRVREILDRAE